jgi:glutathione peroxidase-family protein
LRGPPGSHAALVCDGQPPGVVTFTGENFTKFLISRDGEIVNRFEPAVEPDSPEVTKAIEAELSKK